MKATPLKNIGDSYEAVEFNRLVSQELQNAVVSSGQALDEFDEFQLGQAIAVYAGAGDFYTDSGIVNDYSLSPVNVQQAPPTYTNGLRARFVATNTNTSNTTVNLNGLGVKSIKENGIELVAGRIVTGMIIEIQFLSASDEFELIPLHANTSSVLDLATTGGEIIGNMTFDANGHVQNIITRLLTASNGVTLVGSDFQHEDTSSVSDVLATGAEVIEEITFDSQGHVLTFTKRTLTFADLGGVPEQYAVGDLYFTTTNHGSAAAVAAHFGFGTWIEDWEGLALFGVGNNTDTRGENYTLSAGVEFGRKNHPLVSGENGQHTHQFAMREDGGNSASFPERGSGNSSGTATTTASGAGTPHENMPPGKAAYCWRRVT